MAKSTHQNYYDLSGGQQNRTTKYAKSKSECDFIKNGVFSKVGGIRQRGAYAKLGASVSSTTVLGLAPFNTGLSEYLMAYSNGKMFRYDSSWNAGTTLFTTPTSAEMATFLNQLFVVDVENATTVSSDGVTFVTTGNASGAPQGKYVSEFNARLYIAHCKIGSTYHRSRIYFSSVVTASAVTWDLTEDSGNYVQVETDNGDYIRGLAKYGNRLMIYKLNSLHKFICDDDDNRALLPVPRAVGTSSHRSIVYDRNSGLLYSFHPKFGISAFDGTDQVSVSLGIDDFVRGVASPTSVVGWQDGYILYFYVGAVTHPIDADLNLTNGVFIYDTTAKRWSVGELADVVSCATNWLNGTNYGALFSNNTGEVFRLSDTATSDDGEEVEFIVRTGIIWDQDVATIKGYEKSLLASDPQGCLFVRYRLFDRNGYGHWSQSIALTNPLEEIAYNQDLSDARGMQLEFRSYQAVSQPAVEGFTNFYNVLATDEEEEL